MPLLARARGLLPAAPAAALAILAAGASAQGIAPRNADAVQPRQAETLQPRQVQPRQAEPVQPRYAPAVQPRRAETVPPQPQYAPPPAQPYRAEPLQPYQAPPVQPRVAPMVPSTAVQGTSPNAWQWMQVGDTGVAGDGVGRGSQVKNLRCAGVACRMFQDTGGSWAIRAEGGFPEAPGRTLEVLVMNTRTQAQEGNGRGRGISSDGSFWDQLDTWRLPAGSYAVFYHWKEKDQVLAAMTFDIVRHEVADSGAGSNNAGRAGNPAADAARQRALDTARQNQRCLAMAATNPDVRCVP